MKSKLKLGIVVAIVALAIIGFAPRRANANYTSHAQIIITDNSQFDNAHGVTSGSGTKNDPYIIENWIINPSSGSTGIGIYNTTAYFILRNIIADNFSGMGILIDNVSNGQVLNCDTSYDYWGMEIALSHDMVIANNIAHNATGDFGFDIDTYSYNILFENNVAYAERAEGLVVSGGSYNDNIIGNIIENNIYNPGIRIDYVSNILFSNNTIFWNGWESMRLDNVYNCTFVNNNMDSFAVQLHSSYNKFENNNISGYVGFVSGAFCNIIENCSVHYIEESGAGGMGDNNLFFNNYITESGGTSTTSNSTTKWDNNHQGNYWSLWQPNGTTRFDNDNNGIVDTPRIVTGGGNTEDNYPLVIGGVLTGVFIPNQPDTLKLDNQASPARAKSLHPTFSFRYTDNNGDNLTAFEIQVGTDNLLGDSINDRWDYYENRNAKDDDNVTIVYGENENGVAVVGPISLARGTWYYWRIRTTENANGTSTAPDLVADWSAWSGYAVGSEWAAQKFFTNQLPTCSITADNTTHHDNENFHFYSNSHDNDNDSLTYHWNFGDNTTSTQTNPVHAYSSVGNYNVTLYVSDPYESSVTDNLTVHVTSTSVNHAPTCTITHPLTGYSTTYGAPITFTCTASDPDNDALTYLWDYGNSEGEFGASTTYAYPGAGTYVVILTVSDGSLTGTDRITITITEPSGGGGGGGTPPVATTPPIISSWGIPLWIILAIAAAISYWRKIRIGTYQLAFILIGVLVVLFIFAPSTANYQVITFTGTPPWGA